MVQVTFKYVYQLSLRFLRLGRQTAASVHLNMKLFFLLVISTQFKNIVAFLPLLCSMTIFRRSILTTMMNCPIFVVNLSQI